MKLVYFFLCLFFLGCHPKVGDYYENRATRERVKISFVGQGKEAHKLASRFVTEMNSIYKKTRGYELERIVYSLDDSLQNCVTYEDPTEFTSTLNGKKPFVHHWIKPISRFEQDFVLVN